jgi:hypothetical protein
MFFKRIARLSIAAACLLSVVGCSLNEGPPPPRSQNLGQGNLGCLSDLNAKLVKYFDGKANAADVNSVTTCAINALKTFGDLVEGENRNRFTAEEVRDFLERYFLNDVTFSDSFLRELMRVKQALVGGKVTDFTREDLKGAEHLLEVFRDILVKLQPSMPISVDRSAKADLPYLDSETKAIADAGAIFGRQITERDSTYSFEEMARLLDEVAKAFPGAGGALGSIRSNLHLAGLFKQMLISPDSPRGTVTAAEWQIIFTDGTRWLGNYLKYKNLQGRYPDLSRGNGRARMNVVLNESLDLLDQVLARNCPKANFQPNGNCATTPGIPFKLIQEAMDEVDWDGSIGAVKFEKATLREVIIPFFRHFLGGTDLGSSGRRAIRLTETHIAHLRITLQEFIDGSRYLEGLFANLTGNSRFPDHAMISNAAIAKTDVRSILRANGGASDSAVRIGESLKIAFAKSYAIQEKYSSGGVFDGQNKTRERLYSELYRYTWLSPLLRGAVLGYMVGSDVPNRAANVDKDGLTVDEFTNLIRDYYQVLLDFKLVAKKVNTPEKDGKNRFREASLFTPPSDGNSLISIDEGTQLVLFILSSNPMGKMIHKRATEVCKTGGLDAYGKLTIEPTCFRDLVFNFKSSNEDMASVWEAFPVLIAFYESLDEKKQSEFQYNVEHSIRKPGVLPTNYFGSDECDSMPIMFHYVETLFLKFDVNGDGFIDKSEAKQAFPIFRNILAEKADLKGDDPKLISVFYYLLAKGRPPVDDTMNGWKRFWNSAEFLLWHLTKPGFKADRLNLLKVFATLSNAPSPAPTPSPSP